MAEFDDLSSAGAATSGDYLVGNRGGIDRQFPFSSFFNNIDTDDIAEGSALYYTSERVDDRVAALIQNGTGITWSYNDAGGALNPTISLTPFNTSNLTESNTGPFYVQADVKQLDHSDLTALSSTPISLDTPPFDSGEMDRIHHIHQVFGHWEVYDTAAYTNNGLELFDVTEGVNVFTIDSNFLSATQTDTIYCGLRAHNSIKLTGGGNYQWRAASSDPTGGNANNVVNLIVLYNSFRATDLSGGIGGA